MIEQITLENIRAQYPNAARFFANIRTEIINRLETVTGLKIDDAEGFKKSSTLTRTRKEYLNSLSWLEGEKTDVMIMAKGIERFCRVMKIDGEEVARRFGMTEENAAGFCPQKALNKAAQFFTITGGASNETLKVSRQARILDSHLENAFYSLLEEYRAVRAAKIAAVRDDNGRMIPTTRLCRDDYRISFGYKGLIDDRNSYKVDPALMEKIDAAIDEGRASYETSTINTQGPQVKSMLLSLSAAFVIVTQKNDKGERVTVAKERARGAQNQTLAPRAKFMRMIDEIDRENYHFILRDDTRQ